MTAEPYQRRSLDRGGDYFPSSDALSPRLIIRLNGFNLSYLSPCSQIHADIPAQLSVKGIFQCVIRICFIDTDLWGNFTVYLFSIDIWPSPFRFNKTGHIKRLP